MEQIGREIHVITGDLDSNPDESRVVADHPEGARAANEHRGVRDAGGRNGGGGDTRCVRAFGDDANVEGLAISLGGATWYAHDAVIIRLDEYPHGE